MKGRKIMRKPFIAGNWKMNKNYEEALAFMTEVAAKAPSSDVVESAICAPAIYLDALVGAQGENLRIGAQNMHSAASGAYTGEIAPGMLVDRGVTYVVLGHSERRQYFCETDETVNAKTKAAFDNGIVPIVCVGESLEERETGVTNSVVDVQVVKAFAGLTKEQVETAVVAYEPIWAIGTGKTATAEQADETCGYIRTVIAREFGQETAEAIRIQYGGSVKPANVKELMSKPNIDGALVGGASLDAESFLALLNFNN
jgi:triosephosphate isomerase